MSIPQIVIFYERSKPDAHLLVEALSACGFEATAFNIHESERTTLSDDNLRWGDHDLTRAALIIVLDWQESVPMIPQAEPTGAWYNWRDDFVAQEQRFSFFRSLLDEAIRRELPLWHGSNAAWQRFVYPSLLRKLAQANLPVIDFVVTNDADAVQTFLDEQPGLWRACSGDAPWQHIDENSAKDILHGTPKIVSRLYPGEWVLLFGAWGHTLGVITAEPPDSDYPERLERLTFHQSDAESDQFCAAIERATGYAYFCVQGLLSEHGFRIFEIEPCPLLTHLHPDLARHLARQLAGVISERLGKTHGGNLSHAFEMAVDVEENPVENGMRFERPVLFLRRMLQPLFEIEAQRYSTG